MDGRDRLDFMPRLFNERQSLERELREELPAQLAVSRTRRERLEWEILRVQNRMADLKATLAKVSAESGSEP